MDIQAVEQRATELMDRVGGRIFAFPLDEQDPYSKYAVTMHDGVGFKTFPEPLVIEEAASGVAEILKGLASIGADADYERNVRFVSYEPQMNAPSVTMRRLKKELPQPGLVSGVDIIPKEDAKDGYYFSGRGLVKFTYFSMVDDKLPKAVQFMDSYYKLLSMKRYGKTAAAIKQEVRRMNKDEATRWIERTYARYIKNDMEVLNLMNTLSS